MKKILSALQRWMSKQQTQKNPLDTMPDFHNLKYLIAIEPSGSCLIAWNKLRECERRLEMFKWVEALNDPASPQHRILLNDATSAFLLTYEAVLQFTKEQIKTLSTKQFYEWLGKQPKYDLTVKGLRTLRHFEAHVELKSPQSKIIASSEKVSRTWRLPPLYATDLDRLLTKPLSETDLSDWNSKVDQVDAVSMFTDGIEKLKAILEAAEGIK